MNRFKVGDRVRYRPDKVEYAHYVLYEYTVIESGFDTSGEDCVYLEDEWGGGSPAIKASALMKIETPS